MAQCIWYINKIKSFSDVDECSDNTYGSLLTASTLKVVMSVGATMASVENTRGVVLVCVSSSFNICFAINSRSIIKK